MIMRRGQPLLLPVNPIFIWASLLLALLLSLVPLGRTVWTPDLLLLVLVFWSMHQPLRVGMGSAFFLGLCMDVHQTALLGQHALAYVLLAYLAASLRRQLLWLGVWLQAIKLLPLFFAAHVMTWLLRLLSGGVLPEWWWLLAPLLEALLWPAISLVLLAPQRRALDPDENRPL